jgi:hypothetical protein
VRSAVALVSQKVHEYKLGPEANHVMTSSLTSGMPDSGYPKTRQERKTRTTAESAAAADGWELRYAA